MGLHLPQAMKTPRSQHLLLLLLFPSAAVWAVHQEPEPAPLLVWGPQCVGWRGGWQIRQEMSEPLCACGAEGTMTATSQPAQLHHMGLPMAPGEAAVSWMGEEGEAWEAVAHGETGEASVSGVGGSCSWGFLPQYVGLQLPAAFHPLYPPCMISSHLQTTEWIEGSPEIRAKTRVGVGAGGISEQLEVGMWGGLPQVGASMAQPHAEHHVAATEWRCGARLQLYCPGELCFM